MSPCTCYRGPGKFEGESALAALAYSSACNGCSDMTTGVHDWFKKPFCFDADQENVLFAEAHGFCSACIQEALADDSYGLEVWESDQGFVYLRRYKTKLEYDSALTAAELGDEDEEEDF